MLKREIPASVYVLWETDTATDAAVLPKQKQNKTESDQGPTSVNTQDKQRTEEQGKYHCGDTVMHMWEKIPGKSTGQTTQFFPSQITRGKSVEHESNPLKET